MAVLVSSYKTDVFNQLLPFEDAGPAFDRVKGMSIVKSQMKDLFRKHRVENFIGLQLLHQHFQLYPDQKLVDINGTSSPMVPPQPDSVTPVVWGIRIEISNDIYLEPLEFTLNSGDAELDQASPLSQERLESFLVEKCDFFKEFATTVKFLGIEGLFGFTRHPGTGYPGRIEISGDRVNINLTPLQVGSIHCFIRRIQKANMLCKGKMYLDGKSREAAWYFDDQFVDDGCKCLCPEKDGKHQGHGSHHITQ